MRNQALKELVGGLVAMLIGAALIAIVIACGGCASLETTAYRTIGGVSVTVDVAMTAWGDYVRAGKATPADEAKVKAAYEGYQRAMRAVHGAVRVYRVSRDGRGLQAALEAVASASGQVTGAVKQAGVP
jgi:hypothetical protein